MASKKAFLMNTDLLFRADRIDFERDLLGSTVGAWQDKLVRLNHVY